jgi:hypothetical protein
MDKFSDGLTQLLLSFEVVQASENKYAHLVFAVGCAIFGVLAVVADLALFALRGHSLLKLKHNARNTPLFGLAWGLGTLIIGYLGQVANIFQVSILACVSVGVGWPVVFTELLEKTRKKEDEQEPREEEVEEEQK